MKKYLAALLLCSAPLFAGVKAEEAVFSTLKVDPANGGINPEFAGVTLSGTVFAGGNACQANQYDISLKKTMVNGVLTFKAIRKVKAEGVFCTLQIDPDFKGKAFSQTFVVSRDLLAEAVVKNVYELGNTVSLESLRDENQEDLVDESCNFAPVYCLAVYDPATCTYKDLSARGSNACQARAQLKSMACASEKTFDSSLVRCAGITAEQ